jgi:hypothetical protein
MNMISTILQLTQTSQAPACLVHLTRPYTNPLLYNFIHRRYMLHPQQTKAST